MSLAEGILSIMPSGPVPVRDIFRAIKGEPDWAIGAAMRRLVAEGKLVRVLDQVSLPRRPTVVALETERKCRSCGEFLPLHRFPQRPGQTYHTCKKCTSIKLVEAGRARRKARAEAHLAKCRRCGFWLPPERFALHTSPILAGKRWTTCRECHRERLQQRETHREHA